MHSKLSWGLFPGGIIRGWVVLSNTGLQLGWPPILLTTPTGSLPGIRGRQGLCGSAELELCNRRVHLALGTGGGECTRVHLLL